MARPLKYTQEEFEDKIHDYFGEVSNDKLYTKEGLCVHLGIHRDTYNEWKKPDHQFSDTLKEAEAIIEALIVRRLLTENNPVGKIFYLKNAFGWRDRNETDITSGGDKIIPIYNVSGNNSIKENSEVKKEN